MDLGLKGISRMTGARLGIGKAIADRLAVEGVIIGVSTRPLHIQVERPDRRREHRHTMTGGRV